MAEHSIQRSTSQSFIPVVTPRPSRSSVSNPSPVSQAPLASQHGRTSESSTQANLAFTSITLGPPPPRTPVSSIPSFRSIRNLLPFGPGKMTNPSVTSPANIQKPSFVNFGSMRRVTNDRKNSATYDRPDDSESSPIIAIARSSETFEEEMMARKRSRDLVRLTSDFSPSSRASEDRYGTSLLPAPSPGPPLGADLSTIIEAENSGISKHLPCLDDRTHPDDDTSPPPSPFILEENDKSRLPSPDSREASVFDLSTSRLTAEVMDALMVKDATTASQWLKAVNGVVVEEKENADDSPSVPREAQDTNPGGDQDPDAMFNLGALDPDLAELLSPNRIKGKSQNPAFLRSRLPSRAHSRSPSQPLAATPLSPPAHDRDNISPRNSPRLGSVIPPSPASSVIAQSSPTRRSISLSRANLAHVPASSLPRLMRSVTNMPHNASNSSEGSSTPSGLHGPPKRRHQPPSPLSSQALSSRASSPLSSRGSTDLPARRPATTSRLVAPNRHVSSYTPGSSRLTDDLTIAPIPPSETSPVSHQSSRSTSDPTRQPHSQSSLEFGGALEVNKRRRAHLFYSRKRSMSVEESRLSPTSASSGTSPVRSTSSLSNRPPTMEWLGPRTVKAFAAAGLLDGDRDGPNSHTSGVGRYGSLRSGSEREERYVPSRMAFSEAASTSSWGRRGSVSRVMTPSEGGVTWTGSPTFSVPRTTFSGSTAPTSISASSSAQQATIQLMREKHDLETEALLSALSDSQRTTKTLREENGQLRDRIRELEDQLDEMRDQIHRLASGVPRPPQSVFSKSIHERSIIPPTPLAVPRRSPIHRSLSHIHSNSIAISPMDPSTRNRAESPSRNDPLPRSRPRRASTTSSVFPNLPHNMSMLMLEETMYDRAGALSTSSVSPPSPTLCLPKSPSSFGRDHNNLIQSSISSENLSPSTANFSMTEIPGSPTSLHLRPEHEVHLGDMATLSIYAMSDDEL
ncbi:hypothetical protein BU15DRAFT_49843 [Melanogaster broomeanus]|nr:hypothetical protein BU15DRAFT_49843 [Melanogaster broomeanus]